MNEKTSSAHGCKKHADANAKNSTNKGKCCRKSQNSIKKDANVRESLRENPGAAIDNADSNKVNARLVDERTCALNNNPRNSDL